MQVLLDDRPLGIKDPRDIICLVRSPQKAADLRKKGVTLVTGTLSDRDTLITTFREKNVDVVFHNAANIDPTGNYRNFYLPNVIGTRNMLDAFVQSNAHTFIFASSIAVYDTFLHKQSFTIIDERTPLGPLQGEGYSVSKRKAERLLQEYVQKYPTKRFLITRLGPIVGKNDRQIIPNFIKLLSMRTVPRLIANGRDLFAITNPFDIARAQIFLAEHTEIRSGEAFNVAGQVITYRQIYDQICDFYGFPKPKFSIPIELFNLSHPLLTFSKRFFPNNEFIQKAFSDTALGYIGKTYLYRNRKIERLGFQFHNPPHASIQQALEDLSRLPEYSPYSMQPYLFTFSKKIAQNTAIEIKDTFILLKLVKSLEATHRKQQIKTLIRYLIYLIVGIWIFLYIFVL